jgi:transcriptional repressor NrdR
VDETPVLVVKKDGQREPFDRSKLTRGILAAVHRRTVSADTVEAFVYGLEQKLADQGLREVESRWIGEEVMRFLHDIDQVAYVRFASVYREFQDINEFMNALSHLLRKEGRPRKGGART